MKQLIQDSLDENIELIKKVEQVDWNVIEEAENAVSSTLEEFQ